MTVDGDLAAECNKILKNRRAGYCHARYNYTMTAYCDVVADLDEIVDLGAFADNRVRQGAALRKVCPQLS